MATRPKFCSNCGETLDLNDESKICPKCGNEIYTKSPDTRVVEQLPYKSPGTAALIAFIGGIFGLVGIGHIYVGKVGRGIIILIIGIIMAFILVITLFSFQAILLMSDIGSTEGAAGVGVLFIMMIIGPAYLALWIWQIFNARKLAKKFNESVRATGKEPW